MPDDSERRDTIDRADRTLKESHAIRDAAEDLMAESRELRRILERLQKRDRPKKR